VSLLYCVSSVFCFRICFILLLHGPVFLTKLNDFILMDKEDYDNISTRSDANEEEAVVDMEGELISALEEIERLRIKNKKQRQSLIQLEKDNKEPDEDLVLLKVELEEAKKIKDILK
jgi:hypothetical protein